MTRSNTKKSRIFICCLLITLMPGCTSFGKGIVKGFLESDSEVDNRACDITGPGFDGIDEHLMSNSSKTKILYVHGIGDHSPGYTTEFLDKLRIKTGLTATVGQAKNISLIGNINGEQPPLGNLRATYLTNNEQSKGFIFYELTWSEITRAEKSLLSFDNSDQYTYKRAKFNALVKKFINDTAPDIDLYVGPLGEHILQAYTQSLCWAATRNFEELPDNDAHMCSPVTAKSEEPLNNDHITLISHSLGSRISTDGLQRLAKIIDSGLNDSQTEATAAAVKSALQQKEITLFMLSNQLPMLQMGRPLPDVSNQIREYCETGGKHFQEHILQELNIVSVSDPNDALSYPIPPNYEDTYIDSRLCPTINNIDINIAKVNDNFGALSFANPLTAHTGYNTDDRVIAFIAHGINSKELDPTIKERCDIVKVLKP